MSTFSLSHSELELLLAFESSPSLEGLSKKLLRDPTVISKQLKRLAEHHEVLTKHGGRWVLTSLGYELNRASRDFIQSLDSIFLHKKHIRIGTNREFAARVLAPHTRHLQKITGATSVTLNAYAHGVHDALLHGEIDFGFDCGRPFSPEIEFRQMMNERIVVVCSQHYFEEHELATDTDQDLTALPHIVCDRLSVAALTPKTPSPVVASCTYWTNDIATARAMCVASMGWSWLPEYAVIQELQSGLLVRVRGDAMTEKYGVWKLRARKALQRDFEVLGEWLGRLVF